MITFPLGDLPSSWQDRCRGIFGTGHGHADPSSQPSEDDTQGARGDLFGKTGILSEVTKALAERALSTEMDVHLDGERTGEAPAGQNQLPNRRNGRSQKTVTTDSGKVVLDIPRDRNGTFDPLLIARYQRRFPEFDRKIVSIHARSMTTRESSA